MPPRRLHFGSYYKIAMEGSRWATMSSGAEAVAKFQPLLAGAIRLARQWKVALASSLTTSTHGSSSIEGEQGQQGSVSHDAAQDLAKFQHALAAADAAKKGAIKQARHWKARCMEAAAARSAETVEDSFLEALWQ